MTMGRTRCFYCRQTATYLVVYPAGSEWDYELLCDDHPPGPEEYRASENVYFNAQGTKHIPHD